MLYLTIPLSLAVLALAGLGVIMWRKMAYLRKLTPESHTLGKSFFHDLAPELIENVQSIPWQSHLHSTLTELEKLLRRIRMAMSALDRASDRVIQKVRHVGQRAAKDYEQTVAQREAVKKEQQVQEEHHEDEVDMDNPEQLKAEEQRLIVSIAQNPKDAKLYSELARIAMRLHAYADAVEALHQAVKLDPENERYQKRLERAKRKKAEIVGEKKEEGKEQLPG